MEPLLEDISKENIANCASIPHKFYQRGPIVSHRGRTSTKRPRLFAGAFWRALDHRHHRGRRMEAARKGRREATTKDLGPG